MKKVLPATFFGTVSLSISLKKNKTEIQIIEYDYLITPHITPYGAIPEKILPHSFF